MASWGVTRFALFGSSEERTREFPREVLEKLQPDEPIHLSGAGAWLLKTRAPDRIIALDDRCTHLGCPQKWNADGKAFECPCHGSVFDMEGNVTRGPATRPLLRLHVRLESDGKLSLWERSPGP
jgi:Rieske Fe-S protein